MQIRLLTLKQPCKTDRPSLLFLDNRLPDGLGLNFISFVKEHSPDTKIVMITAHDDASEKAQAYKEGADLFLGKPLNRDTINQAIDRLVYNIDTIATAGPLNPDLFPILARYCVKKNIILPQLSKYFHNNDVYLSLIKLKMFWYGTCINHNERIKNTSGSQNISEHKNNRVQIFRTREMAEIVPFGLYT